MTGAKYCSVHSTTRVLHWMAFAMSPHILMRRKFSIHWEMLWLQCFPCSVNSFSQTVPGTSTGGSLFSSECHMMAWWWAIHCESLSGRRKTSIVLVVKMTSYDQTVHLCFWHILNFIRSSFVHSTTQSSPDIERRSAITRVAMQNLDNQIWKSRIAISTKLKLHNNCVLPILLYGSECWWAVIKRDVLKIDALDQWCLWKLLGIKWYHNLRNDEVRWTTRQLRLSAIVQPCMASSPVLPHCTDDKRNRCQGDHNSFTFVFGELGETTRTSSYYMDEDYLARPEI